MARYTLELGTKADEQLTRLSQEKETTKSEIIRRALATYANLSSQVDAGNKVAVTKEVSSGDREVILP